MKRLPNLVSNVANPFVIFTVLYGLVAVVHSGSFPAAAGYLALELLAAGLVAGYVFWMRRRRRVGGFWIPTRRERLVPALVLLASFVGLLAALLLTDSPPELFRLTLSMGVASATVAAITTVWKASAHTAVAGHAAAAGLFLLGGFGVPFVLLLPLVAWARVEEKAHTLSQTLAGAVIGVVFAWILLA